MLQSNDGAPKNFRNGAIRFAIGSIVANIGVVISITRLMQRNINKLDGFNTVLSILNIWLIDKSRTALLYIIIMILITILIGKKQRMFWKAIIFLGIIACAMGVFVSFNTVSNDVTSYFNADAGIMMRFKTIDFYMVQFTTHPIFGTGLLSSCKDVSGWQLLYDPAGYFYRDNVGIVELLNKIGLCGLFWVVLFLQKLVKKGKRTRSQGYELLRNIVIYCAVTMINLSFMDFQRVFYMRDLMILTEALMMSSDEQTKLDRGRVL